MDKKRIKLPEKAFERGRELMNKISNKTKEKKKGNAEKIERVQKIYEGVKKRERKLKTKLEKIRRLRVKLKSFLHQYAKNPSKK